MELLKSKHAAGGFIFKTTEGKGNTKFGDAKKKAIIDALNSSWTEGVYLTTTGKLIQQMLNGTSKELTKDSETGEYYFA